MGIGTPIVKTGAKMGIGKVTTEFVEAGTREGMEGAVREGTKKLAGDITRQAVKGELAELLAREGIEGGARELTEGAVRETVGETIETVAREGIGETTESFAREGVTEGGEATAKKLADLEARLVVTEIGQEVGVRTSRSLLNSRWIARAALIPPLLLTEEYMSGGALTKGGVRLLHTVHDSLKENGYDELAGFVKENGLGAFEKMGELMDTPRQLLVTAGSEALELEGQHEYAEMLRIGNVVMHTGFAVSLARIAQDDGIEDKATAVIDHIADKANVSEETIVSYLSKTPLVMSAFPSEIQQSLRAKYPQLEEHAAQAKHENPAASSRTKQGVDGLTGGITDMTASQTSRAFNVAADKLDSLGVGKFAKFVFKALSAASTIVGLFHEKASQSIQRLALDATGVGKALEELQAAAEKGKVVSQMAENKFASVLDRSEAPAATSDVSLSF